MYSTLCACVHVCSSLWTTHRPKVSLGEAWTWINYGSCMRWFCGRLGGGDGVVTPVNSVTANLKPAPWHGAVGMLARVKMTPSFSPFRPEGEISHIWFIYSFVLKYRNIKKEIQIFFKEWENPSFPAGWGSESNFLRNAGSPLLRRYIGAALYWDPNRYKWRFNLVSLAVGLRALPRVWGVLPRADADKSVTWWNPSPGPQT